MTPSIGRRRRRRAWERWLGDDGRRIIELVAALEEAASAPLDHPAWRHLAVRAHDAGTAMRRRWADLPPAIGVDAVLLLGTVEELEEALLRLEPPPPAVVGVAHHLTDAIRLARDLAAAA